jgi:spermidine synthase
MSTHRLSVAVTFSGAASLIYQVAWTRRLISITSATALAQAVVLAVFMAGLGFGAVIAARRVGRVARPFRAYAAVEIGAALAAIVSIPLIDGAGVLRASFGPSSSAMWIELAGVAGFLLIPTTLLGASLPLVLEGLERRARSENAAAPQAVGLIYGLNTLGAALGCTLAGFYSIEHLGLRASTAAGAGLATVAAILAATASSPGVAPASNIATDPRDPPIEIRWWVLSVISGFVGLGAEVICTRLLASVVYNTVYAFSEVLIGVLLGIAAGGFIAAVAARQRSAIDLATRAARTAGLLQAAAAVLWALLPSLLLAVAAPSFKLHLAEVPGWWVGGTAIAAIAVPMALTSAALPLLVTATARDRSASTLGLLYGANTFGGVAGSLLIGLWALPWLGIHWTLSLLVLLGLAGGIVLLWPSAGQRHATAIGALTTATALALLASYRLPIDIYRATLPADEKILELKEGLRGDVFVTDDPRGRRRLWINSAWVAIAGGGAGYGHLVLGDFPALLHPHPSTALGIALGSGQTFGALLSHDMTRLDCVEINRDVVELSRTWFSDFNHGLFDRPEVGVRIDDGRAFLRATPERYDLVVLEPLQAWSAGTSNLYSEEFYRDAARVMGDDGILLQWIPFYGQGAAETKAMVKSGQAVLPHASLWLAGNDGMLILHKSSQMLDPEEIERRLTAAGPAERMRRFGLESGADLLSHVVLGPRGVRTWVADAEVITDDRPFLEFAAARHLGRRSVTQIAQTLESVVATDDLSDYLSASSTVGSAAIAEVRSVRRTILATMGEPDRAYEQRAVIYERGLHEAPGSLRLRNYYRSHVAAWIRELRARRGPPEAIAAIEQRAAEALGEPK